MIHFYDNNMSVCAQKVRLVLAAKGLAYERHHLDLRAGDQFRPEYLALNPKAVVPTIVDQGAPIIESTAIIAYLDDTYPEPSLKPADPLQRAAMWQWMILPDGSLHDACGLASFAIAFRHQLARLEPAALEAHYAKMPDATRRENVRAVVEKGLDAPGIGVALTTYRNAIRSMASELEKTAWLVADTWSLADITMLPYVLRLEHLGLDWFWEDAPLVADWLERSKARSEYEAIDEHLVPAYVELMTASGIAQADRVRAIVSE